MDFVQQFCDGLLTSPNLICTFEFISLYFPLFSLELSLEFLLTSSAKLLQEQFVPEIVMAAVESYWTLESCE